MLSEGTTAPLFELPALVDGDSQRVELSDYLCEDVVILAFYPADFNPACDETSCDLDELDLFTMQKDVTILGISPDSVYSHRAFADRYGLKIPLLSDTDHDVAREYGLDFIDNIGQRLIERAVVVIDHDGDVQYTWSTDDLQALPRVGEIKDAIADTGGDDTAFARYRVGHAHYTEGRRAFTSAMSAFGESEWMVAQGDFQQARDEFADAEDHFDTAVRFVDDESLKPIYEDAKTKANSLWQASDWLTQAARAYSSGNGAEGQQLRDDAEQPLETARGYGEPPDPDGPWPPDLETLETDTDDDRPAFLTQDETAVDTSLDVDIDAEVERTDSELSETASSATESMLDSTPSPDPADATDNTRDTADEPTADSAGETTAEAAATAPSDETPAPADQSTASVATASSADDAPSESASPPDGEGEISDVDDTDIEEIQAELAASEAETEPTDPLEETPTAMVEEPPDTVGSGDDDASTQDAPDGEQSTAGPSPDAASVTETDDAVELDLADPTAADDSDTEESAEPERTDDSVPEATDEPSDAESDRDTSDEPESDP
ncbi:redoxin domain-containing protein [Haloarcula japonica]|uniref:thioredoxin-dependent peroxiredoxin n=1 Tax=Haloarcula japonica (strain ATCC 49778 / DSM 6131 / JCM 7785 / NBRC 101032 / NCIMB 13157 / TR-1) TaxID=1227453 RepID=M0LP15_HALJT|nr:redoxin domain-containing protein [Haloarcula japonica]EMA34848.1 monooxygenase [Haloarcula japonica DSM 6131]